MVYLELPKQDISPQVKKEAPKTNIDSTEKFQDGGTPENDTRPSWTHYESNLKEYLKGFRLPKFLKDCISNPEVNNFTYTALSFFINSTLKRPHPLYTWIDLPVPDQLIDTIGARQITIDGTGKTISIYR